MYQNSFIRPAESAADSAGLVKEQPFYEKIGVAQEDFEAFARECEEHVARDSQSLLGFEKPGYVVVWAQWSNIDGRPEAAQAVPPGPWFQELLDATGGRPCMISNWHGGDANGEGLAFLTGQWTWPIRREFLGPYVKRTYVTNSTTLNASGWVDVMVERMGVALDGWRKGARLVMQVFLFGGPLSALITNPQRVDTSYSWRADAKGCTVQLVQDCFTAVPHAMVFAHAWAAKKDAVFKGPNST